MHILGGPLPYILMAQNVIWAFVGWQFCGITHRQRGIKTDPWEQVIVPDFPPDGLLREPMTSTR